MEAYNNFKQEINHLEMLHAATLFSYDETILRSTQRAKDGFIDKEEPIFRTLAGGTEFKLADNLKSLHNKYKLSFRIILRENIFVRAISALEVFLIDAVREILLTRKDLLIKHDIVTLSYPHLLSFENSSEILSYIVNNECRNLHNGGFKEISKYFRNRLKIELNNFNEPLKLIFEYHDKRHLIVHRLGLTDKEYRHKYNTKIKQVDIDEKYLLSAFKNIRAFCEFVLNESEKVIIVNNNDLDKADLPRATIALKILDMTGYEVIKGNFVFSFDDNIVQLKDLSLQTIEENDIYSLIISGDINYLKRYISILKNYEIKKSLEIINIDLIENKQTKKKNVPMSPEIIEKITNLLPTQPWETGIHKIIAKKLNISSTVVRAVIKNLIRDGIFKHQINGKIIL